LTTIEADTGYAPGTGYEYAKVLMYALEWLAQEHISLTTHEPIGHSLLMLSRADMRTLFAWLDIPARQKTAQSRSRPPIPMPLGMSSRSITHCIAS